jgi:hypothetical protein
VLNFEVSLEEAKVVTTGETDPDLEATDDGAEGLPTMATGARTTLSELVAEGRASLEVSALVALGRN